MTDIKTKPKTHRPNASRKPLTPEEAVRESVGIRWVAGTSIAGRPTLHDVFDYIVERGPAIDCNCERCADWKARFAAGAGAVAPWRASQALAQAAAEMKQVRDELELAAAEGESATAETSRVLKRALEALELVMLEAVGDGIQVRQRIGAELAYGIDHTIGALREHIALLADEASDAGGSEAPASPANGAHPSHNTRISMDASSYDEICTKCGATDIAGGGWGRLAQPCPALEVKSSEGVDISGTPQASVDQPESGTPEAAGSEAAKPAKPEPFPPLPDGEYKEWCAADNRRMLGRPPLPGDAELLDCTQEELERKADGVATSGTPQGSGDAVASQMETGTPEPEAPQATTPPADSGSSAAPSPLTAVLGENLRNSGPKWVFGTPVAKA